MPLQFRRGASSGLSTATVANGEPLYDYTNNRLYLGYGSTAHLIGSPRATEWAQCLNAQSDDIAQSTATDLTWDTSGTNVSDSDLYTVASTGITVAKVGTYMICGSVLGTGGGVSTSNPLSVAFTINGTPQTLRYEGLNSRTQYHTITMQEIVRLAASDEVGIESKHAGSVAGDVDADAGNCILQILRLDAE